MDGNFTFTDLDGDDEYTLYFNSEHHTFTEPFPYIAVYVPTSTSSVVIDYGIGAVAPPPVVTLERIADATEGGATGTFRFTRTGSTSHSLIANFTVGGTATSGSDFTSLGTTVTFGYGQATADVTLTAQSDTSTEGDETVLLTISSGMGYTVGAAASATVTIADVPPGTVSGVVWVDGNDNDVRDGGESALAGVTVTLLDADNNPATDANGNALSPVTTGSNGEYTFAGLYTGDYVVEFSAPSGYVLVGNSADLSTSVFVYASDTATLNTPAFAATQTGSISGLVWEDNDGDGWVAGYESGLAGVGIVVKDASNNTVGTATTTAGGTYTVSGLAAGTYTVEFTAPTGYLMAPSGAATWTDTVSTPGPNSSPSTAAYRSGTLSGVAWVDANANGTKDSGEAALSGVVAELLDEDGTPVLDGNSNPITATTDSGGAYALTNLAPGRYTVRFTAPTGYMLDGASDTLSVTGGVLSAQTNTVDVPVYSAAGTTAVSGIVWVDANGNSVQDVGESGLSGVSVTLVDENDNPAGSATTASDGSYSITGLAAGTYAATFTAPTGYVMGNSGQTSWAAVVSTPGPFAVLSAGAYQTGTVSGTVWIDTDADGVQDTGENGLAGVAVTLFDPLGTEVVTATTGLNGAYSIAGLAPDVYTVNFVAPSGYTLVGSSDTRSVSKTVSSAQTVATNVAAYPTTQTGGVSGVVWEDANGDGVQGVGESALAGVLVELLDEEGNAVLDENDDPIQLTTDITGSYSFDDLEAGTYLLQFTAPVGYVMGSTRDAVSISAFDTPGPLTVVNEAAYQPGPLNGVVWLDEPGWNGSQDSGENGLTGVTVTLYGADGVSTVFDENNDPVLPTTTDSNGAFAFQGLLPGEYTVRLEAPAGYAFEGSGISVWLGSFIVGRDLLIKVGAYEQITADNPLAQPVVAPAPLAVDGVWRVASTMSWNPTPKPATPRMEQLVRRWMPTNLPSEAQSAVAFRISAEELQAIAPRGVKFPAGLDTMIRLTTGAGVQVTQADFSKVQQSVLDEMKKVYKGIVEKDTASRQQDNPGPAPNHEDLLELMNAIPRGLAKAGVKGVQAHIGGGLPQWILEEGLGINPNKVRVESVFDFKPSKNWNNIGKIEEASGSLKFTFGQNKATFTPTLTVDDRFSFKRFGFSIVIPY